jgi:hypothetical protein
MNARWGMKSGLWVIGAMWLLGSAQALALGECAKLTTLHIEETTIESATEVEAGIFKAPGLPNPLRNLPHFCRVTGVIKPEVRFEVWLPLAKWKCCGRYRHRPRGDSRPGLRFQLVPW